MTEKCTLCGLPLSDGQYHNSFNACMLALQQDIENQTYRLIDVCMRAIIAQSDFTERANQRTRLMMGHLEKIASELGIEWSDGEFPIEEVVEAIWLLTGQMGSSPREEKT